MCNRSFEKRHFFIVAIMLSLCGCGPAPWEHPPVEQVFLGQALPEQQLLAGVNVVQTGDRNKPMLIFIHGSPGSWDGWIHYLADRTLQQQFHLVAVDRPGFGDSEGKVVPELALQAERLKPVFELLAAGQKAILVGHSLGGPIALQMAAMYPDKVAGLLLIAASLDPELEKPRWYNRLANSWVFSWAIPEAMLRSNEEMMVLSAELAKQLGVWPQVSVPIVVMQGLEDDLVYPENADYAERQMVKPQLRVVRVPDEGHFLIWTSRAAVTTEIQRLLGQVAL